MVVLEFGTISTPVIREFLDIFRKDLPSLPLDREVEFVVDLIPRTSQISKAPYRRTASKTSQEEF